jgi:hypothetical protein
MCVKSISAIRLRGPVAGGLLLAVSACYTLPSVDEQKAAREVEFSASYRMAVSAMQNKLEPEESTIGIGLVPALFREFNESIAAARIGDVPGGAPVDRLDVALRNFATNQLGVDATILPRASYGANDDLIGNDDVLPRDAVDAAKREGYDGILLLVVQPNLRPQGMAGSAGFRLTLDARTVMRSIRKDVLLMNEVETVGCNKVELDERGQPKEVVLLKGQEVPQGLSDCYDNLVARLPAVLAAQLAR